MKNTFGVTIALLLALTIGGSYLGFKKGLAPAHGAAHSTEDAHSTAEAGMTDADHTSTSEPGTTAGQSEHPAAESHSPSSGATGQQPAETVTAAGGTNAAKETGDPAAGATKFTATCAACHGEQAQGGVGPALASVNKWTLEQFTTALREGRTPTRTLGTVMPKFTADQVTDQDIANIKAHLKGLP